jgi:RHS repeat-associated protein
MRTLLWDSEDRIRAISDGGDAVLDASGEVIAGRGRTTEFVYDAGGQRVFKRGAQGETAYVNPYYTLRNGTVATKHVFVGTSRVTSKLVPGSAHALSSGDTDASELTRVLGRWWEHRSQSGWEHASNLEMNPHYRVPTKVPSPMGLPESNFIYFYHPDHLGSTSFVTDGDGEIYQHIEYFPHGEVWADERSNTERLPYLFTGKELDQETGLYDFGARMYDPRVGLWVSPDPALPEYLSGQLNDGVYAPININVYAFVMNNQLKYVDPDGRAPNQAGTTDMSTVVAEIAYYESLGMLPWRAMAQLSRAHGRNEGRYLYTEKYGWIDLRHFGRAAEEASEHESVLTELGGLMREIDQWFAEADGDYQSAFSPEDLPSNAAGAEFGDDYIGKYDSAAEAFSAWLENVGGRDDNDPRADRNRLPAADPAVRGGTGVESNSSSAPQPVIPRVDLAATTNPDK